MRLRHGLAIGFSCALALACDGGAEPGPITPQGGSSGQLGSGGAGASSTGGSAPSGGTGAGATAGGVSSGGAGAGGAASGGASNGGASSGGVGSGGLAGGGAGQAGSSGSAGSGGAPGAYRPCPTNGNPCKILPFGDSITDGFGTAGAYRVELFRRARLAGKNITFVGTGSNGPPTVEGVAFPPNHEGHSGFTIAPTPSRAGIAPLVATVMPEFTPHVVLLMIGTNDAIDDYQLAAAPARLEALIDGIFARLPEVLMIVAQPIPSQDDALNARIRTYNAALPAVVSERAAEGRHILLVDMYAPFVADASYKTTLLKDTWHPNEAGHAILGARWYAALEPSL